MRPTSRLAWPLGHYESARPRKTIRATEASSSESERLVSESLKLKFKFQCKRKFKYATFKFHFNQIFLSFFFSSSFVHSFRLGHDGLQWFRIWHLLRSAADVTVLPDPPGRESSSANDFHVHANVLHLHELEGRYSSREITSSILPNKRLTSSFP